MKTQPIPIKHAIDRRKAHAEIALIEQEIEYIDSILASMSGLDKTLASVLTEHELLKPRRMADPVAARLEALERCNMSTAIYLHEHKTHLQQTSSKPRATSQPPTTQRRNSHENPYEYQ